VRGETLCFRWDKENSGYFNPLSPCGERLSRKTKKRIKEPISIHSPRAGRDATESLKRLMTNSNFNPLSPCGERQATKDMPAGMAGISIHSPRAGRDKFRNSQRAKNS